MFYILCRHKHDNNTIHVITPMENKKVQDQSNKSQYKTNLYQEACTSTIVGSGQKYNA